MEKEKDVTIEDTVYRLTKMTPRSACWVFMVGRKMADGSITEAEFSNLQNHCLKSCFRLDKTSNLPVGIMGPDGKIDAEVSAAAMFALTMEAFNFNTAPFVPVVEKLTSTTG